MGLKGYLRASLWDFVLCSIASSSLCYVCLIAFISTLPYSDAPWIVIAACTIVTAGLFVTSYSLRTAIIGSIVLVFAFAIALAMSWSSSGALGLFDDIVGNGAYLVVLVSMCSVAVFGLSRKRGLSIVLLVGGVVLCCAIEYLYWDNRIVGSTLYLLSVICLSAYRYYQSRLIGSDSEEVSFGSVTLAAFAMGAVSVALAIGVFSVFIVPLGHPSLTMKLLTKHVRLDEEHVVGTGDEVSVINELLFSWNVSGTSPATKENEGRDSDAGDTDESENGGEKEQETAGSSFNIDGTGVDLGSAVRIRVPDWLAYAVPFALLFLVGLTICARKLVRRYRVNRIRALPGPECVEAFFLMFVKAFGKMGMAVPAGRTLREFADGSTGEIGRFEGVMGRTAFADLTETYSRVVYGEENPDDGEIAAFNTYYKSFYRNARKYVGTLRYVVLFFRI